MQLDAITPEAVREALRAVRFGKPLGASPLLGLDAVTLGLREAGLGDTAATRAWMLGRLLDDLSREALGRARGEAEAPRPGESPEAALGWLRDDFRRDRPDVEALGVLRFRYFVLTRIELGEVAEMLGVVYRTLARRLALGHTLVARALVEAERAAAGAVAVHPGAPARERVVVAPAAERSRGSSDSRLDAAPALASLLAAVRSDEAIVRLEADEVSAIVERPVADELAYRLGRIVEWCQPRYRLDERFVTLSLLVDAGEESAAGRWQAQPKRYTDLGALLDEVEAPAVVVLGPPGSGKSTLLRHFELERAVAGVRGEGALTFFVQLNRMPAAAEGGGWVDPGVWLEGAWRRRYPALPPLADLVGAGRMVLLLDALNEMPARGAAEYRERILAWRGYVQAVAGTGSRVVFSCRSLDYSAPLSTPAMRVPQVRVEALDDEQVRAFLERYAPADAAGLWAALREAGRMELVRTPYFLKLLVEHVAGRGGLPRGRAALFTSYVRRALRREIERDNRLFRPNGLIAERDYERVVQARGWPSEHALPERGRLFGLLSGLAYGMQAERTAGEGLQVRLGYDAALGLVGEERGEDVLRAGAALGVLDEDRGRDEVLFAHQLLQEYFAARRYALAPEAERVRAAWRIDEVRPGVPELLATLPASEELPPLAQTGWEETALLGAAMAADTEGYVRAIATANLALAGRCANLPEVRPRLGEGYLDELRWALVRRSRDPEADLRDRIACGLAVGELGDPRFERRVGPYGEYLMPPLVEIPGGVYPIGEDEAIEWAYAQGDETRTDTAHMPRHDVEIAPLAIGQFPVTNAEWRCFIESGGYEDKRWWETEDAQAWRRGELANEGAKFNNRGWRKRFQENPHMFEQMIEEGRIPSEEVVKRWRGWMLLDDANFEATLDAFWKAKRVTEPAFWHDERLNGASQPVVGVCWYEVRAYCSWMTVQTGMAFRLPTEAEWEAAARGVRGRLYAYGDAFDVTKGNTIETHMRGTTPVGVFFEGDTPEGVNDMAGNVGQWTSSGWGDRSDNEDVPQFTYPYDPNDGREAYDASPRCARVWRGGSWNNVRVNARAAYRYDSNPDGGLVNVGFRVVMTAPSR